MQVRKSRKQEVREGVTEWSNRGKEKEARRGGGAVKGRSVKEKAQTACLCPHLLLAGR